MQRGKVNFSSQLPVELQKIPFKENSSGQYL